MLRDILRSLCNLIQFQGKGVNATKRAGLEEYEQDSEQTGFQQYRALPLEDLIHLDPYILDPVHHASVSLEFFLILYLFSQIALQFLNHLHFCPWPVVVPAVAAFVAA